MRNLIGAVVIGALAFFSGAVRAGDYPTRTITMIVPFGAGSGSDTVTRVIAHHLEPALKQSIVTEDRPGANGGIAAAYVANSAPNGYTLFAATNSPLSANPFFMKSISYDPVKDFAPITRIGSFTLMLVVNPEVPVKSIAELIAYAKAHPGKLSYASGNTAGVVGGKTLANYAGVDMLHVPYKSSPPAIEDVIAGRVSMMFADFTVAMPHVSAGQVRALAVTRIKRSALFPDMPTLDEAGIKGFNLDAWAGLVAPAGTPPEVIATLNGALRKVIDSPEVQAKFKNIGFEGFSSTPEELGNFIKVQLGEWGKMVKEAGLSPE
jgi:tripartite-type tricarboxylate transporter receptor subunit TctC